MTHVEKMAIITTANKKIKELNEKRASIKKDDPNYSDKIRAVDKEIAAVTEKLRNDINS